MRKAFLSVGLFVMLAGCPQPPPPPLYNNTAVPLPLPTGTPTPTAWLSIDPICTGSITRAEWLVCDNAQLNTLHRRLAQQWATARQYASDERMGVLEDQLYALMSERDACQDAACVANAYRRYIDGAVAPLPGPPKPKPKPPKKPVKKPWHRGQHGYGGGGGGWDGRDEDGPSCSATAGVEAMRLARQCDRVTPGQGWTCSPQRSCGALKRNIAKGCNETYRKPDFCPHP
jgi:hypothetical protein